jgi:CCR4-NOT transcriptional complex subunit CAF120
MSCVRPFICNIYTTQRNHHPQTVHIPKCDKIITLSTPGATIRYIFSCHSVRDFYSWVAAFRLSRWEKSRLEEMYTAQVIRTTINDSGNVPSTLTDGKLEGWVRVRIAGRNRTKWKKFWMCVSAGTKDITLNPEHDAWDSPHVTPKKVKCGIFCFFSRDQSSVPSEQANIFLYNGRRRKYKKLVLKFKAVTQAFAVYPERPSIISSHAVIRLEGTCYDKDILTGGGGGKECETWMLLMPDLEGTGIEEVLRWLIGENVPFAESF